VAALIDTNILVYRFHPRFPQKQRNRCFARRLKKDTVRIPHQALMEFMAVVTKVRLGREGLLLLEHARRETEELLMQFTILYPNDALVRTALRGAAAYRLSWFDAHL
jgi:predicted nucleic acid-binding protein